MKEDILDFLESKLLEKITSLEIDLAGVQAAIWEETKSSAGDKYETGRAMAQNTQKMYLEQLARLKDDLNQFTHLKTIEPNNTIQNGSILRTDLGIIFLGVSIGSFQKNDQKVISVSAESPLGKNLLGKTEKDNFELNKKVYSIEIM